MQAEKELVAFMQATLLQDKSYVRFYCLPMPLAETYHWTELYQRCFDCLSVPEYDESTYA